MDIKPDDLTSLEVIQLLQDHLDEMALHSPPESMHALDLQALKQAEVSFWTVWESDVLVGCGAIKRLSDSHAEIKSMRTACAHRGSGVAKVMLAYILEYAQQQNIKRLSLETGSMEGFIPARRLYEAHGFDYCEPFEGYTLDPHSVFMTRKL